MGLDDPLKAWFCATVLPMEGALTRYLRRNWRNESEVTELRQDIYAKVIEGARTGLPRNAQAYVFAVARNHLINRTRRARIVSIESVADLEQAHGLEDPLTPERVLSARDELRQVQAGLDRLPKRCREVIVLRKVEGLSQKEVAERMGISLSTVEQQTTRGMRLLVDFVLSVGAAPEPATERAARRDLALDT